MTYLGEWLTLDQAANVLGIRRAELRELWEDGLFEVEQIRPGAWRIQRSTVEALARSAQWKARDA